MGIIAVVVAVGIAIANLAFNADKQRTFFGTLGGRILTSGLSLVGAAIILFA